MLSVKYLAFRDYLSGFTIQQFEGPRSRVKDCWTVAGRSGGWRRFRREESRQIDVRLPGKGNSNSHGARPVYLIIKMIKWIRTGRLSIKNSLSGPLRGTAEGGGDFVEKRRAEPLRHAVQPDLIAHFVCEP